MSATTTTYEKGKLFQLDLTQLQTDPNQPRKYMDPLAMEEMTASVTKHGILQPIIFRVDEARATRSSSPAKPRRGREKGRPDHHPRPLR